MLSLGTRLEKFLKIDSNSNKVTCFVFLYFDKIPYRCGCDECMTSRQEDSLRHSRSRINAYRALASPSLIALSSKDPILTAFELSWELRRLSFAEHEFKSEYMVCIALYSTKK